MRKVIVKVWLGDHLEFRRMLQDIGMEFSEVMYQHDRVYVPRGYKRGENYPRMIVRTEMASVDKPPKYKLILRRHIEDSDVDVTDESGVDDYAEVVRMIHQLGFEAAGETSRQRRELRMGDSVNIYLDKVEGVVGYFAKIESVLEEGESVGEVREDLLRTFEVLGESREGVVEKTYVEIAGEAKQR